MYFHFEITKVRVNLALSIYPVQYNQAAHQTCIWTKQVFQVTQLIRFQRTWTSMPTAWPGFMNGIHGLPTLSNGRRLWESILGKPAPYGCIILKLDAAEWLYNWAEDGVVVEIQA